MIASTLIQVCGMDHRVVQLSEPPYYEQRDRLASNVVGYLKGGVSKPVLQRAFEHWRNIDKVRLMRRRAPLGLFMLCGATEVPKAT